MWRALIFALVTTVACVIARIDQFELKSGRLGRDADNNLVAVELKAKRTLVHDSPFSAEMEALCTTAAYMHPDECRHCLSSLFEWSLLRESRPFLDDRADTRPYKDRTIRLLSRVYRVLGEDRSMKHVCLVGHFEEQLLRFLAVYLQRHDDLRVSLFLLHYGSSQNPGNDEYDNSNSSNSNIAAMRRIVNRILLDFHLSSGRIRYEMATDVHQLDLSAIRHCDILHVQDIQRQNAMVGYPDTLIKTTTSDSDSASGSSNSQERRRMVSWTDLYAILRVRLTEPTLVIYATDDTRAFEQVTVPLQETIPVDLQSSLTWLASSIVFDGQVQYDVPEVWEEADLPQHIKSSCGRLVSHIGDIFVEDTSTTMYVGRLVPPVPVSPHVVTATTRPSQPPPHPPSPSASHSSPRYVSFDVFRQQTSIWITFAFPLFIETAHGLRKALIHELGWVAEQVHVVGYLSWKELVQQSSTSSASASTTAASSSSLSTTAIQICIGAHQGETWLLPHYLIFHTENQWNSYLAKSVIYTRLLQAAQGVMAYSPAHLAFLRHVRGAAARTTDLTNDRPLEVVVPFFTDPLYYEASVVTSDDGREWIAVQPRFCDQGALPQGIEPWLPCHRPSVIAPVFDVAMLGTRSPRRREFLQQIVLRFIYEIDPVTNVLTAMRTPSERTSVLVNFIVHYLDLHTRQRRGLEPYEQFGLVFDVAEIYAREALSLLTRVTLNVHQNEHAVFETHRVNSLLALGLAVVSERSTYVASSATDGDTCHGDATACHNRATDHWQLEEPYEAAAAVRLATQWTDVIDTAAHLASPPNQEALRIQQVKAFRFYKDYVARNVTSLRQLLHALYVSGL